MLLRLCLFAVSVAVAAGLAELALRFWPVSPVPVSAGAPFKYVTIGDAITYEPGAHFVVQNDDGESITVDIDARGFRNPAGAPELASGGLLLLGDSFTAALNTPEDRSMAGVLRSQGWRVTNAGVDGIGTSAERAIFTQRFPDAHDVVVALNFYLGNDFRDNYWTAPLPGRPKIADGMLATIASAAAWCSTLRLCALVQKQSTVSPYSRDPMGGFAMSELVMLRGASEWRQRALEATRSLLEGLVDAVASRRSTLIVVGIPSKTQVVRDASQVPGLSRDVEAQRAVEALRGSELSWDDPDHLLADLCRQLHVEYVSLLDRFRSAQPKGALYHHVDQHWNEAGQREAAAALATVLAAR